MRTFFREHFLAVSIIISISIYSLWPVLQDPVRRAAEKWDGVLMVWYLNQTVQKIPNDLGNIFQANIFYPYKNVMAFSDMHIPSAFASYFPTILMGEPVIALNVSLLFGQIATILICYLWFWGVTKNKTAALISSLALGVSVTRMSFIMHLQMWNHQWWLFSAYLFWKYFKKRDVKYLTASAVFIGIQMWESPLGVYFAAAVMLFIGIGNLKTIIKNKIHFIIFVILAGLIMIPPVRAYLSVSNEFGYVRIIRDAANFSPGIDILLKNVFTDGVFLGLWVLVILKAISIKVIKQKWLVSLIFTGLILSLGPVLKVGSATFKIFDKFFVPLPYGVLYYIVPGFSAFRAPGRWLWVGLFAAAFLLCIGLSEILRKKKGLFQNAVVITVCVITLLPVTKTTKYYVFGRVNEYPKVYTHLKDLPDGVLLEVPIYSWVHGEIASIETARMVYSLYHGKYLLGGASGYEPESWNEVRNSYWQSFPSDEFDEAIKERKVDYILIWKDLIEAERLDEMARHYGLSEYKDPTHILYAL